MQTRIQRLWPVLVVVAIAAIALLAFPYLASAYYLEAGGRALQDLPLHRGGSQRAIAYLERSIAWDSDNAQAYRLLARVYHSSEDWQAAAEALAQYIGLRPENPLGYLEFAELYEELEKRTETDAADERLRQQMFDLAERTTDAWRGEAYTQAQAIDTAKAAQAAGRPEEALVWLWRAVALQPEVGDARYQLGLWYQELQLYPEAVRAFERALEIGDFERVSPSDPAYHAGLLYQSRLDPRDPARALALYDSALALNQFSTPAKLADCHYQRGEILRGEGHSIEEYIAVFEAAIASDPLHAWAHARLGYAYYQRDGNVAAAEAELEKAIALKPTDRWLYVILGDIYRLEERREEARAEYDQALEIDPDFEAARSRLQAMDDGQ